VEDEHSSGWISLARESSAGAAPRTPPRRQASASMLSSKASPDISSIGSPVSQELTELLQAASSSPHPTARSKPREKNVSGECPPTLPMPTASPLGEPLTPHHSAVSMGTCAPWLGAIGLESLSDALLSLWLFTSPIRYPLAFTAEEQKLTAPRLRDEFEKTLGGGRSEIETLTEGVAGWGRARSHRQCPCRQREFPVAVSCRHWPFTRSRVEFAPTETIGR
jgi:hypothetical protein